MDLSKKTHQINMENIIRFQKENPEQPDPSTPIRPNIPETPPLQPDQQPEKEQPKPERPIPDIEPGKNPEIIPQRYYMLDNNQSNILFQSCC